MAERQKPIATCEKTQSKRLAVYEFRQGDNDYLILRDEYCDDDGNWWTKKGKERSITIFDTEEALNDLITILAEARDRKKFDEEEGFKMDDLVEQAEADEW